MVLSKDIEDSVHDQMYEQRYGALTYIFHLVGIVLSVKHAST